MHRSQLNCSQISSGVARPWEVKKGIQGTITLRVRVDESGNVEAVRVVFSIPLLDQAAIDAVKQWKFKPKIIKKKARPVVFAVSVPFYIE